MDSKDQKRTIIVGLDGVPYRLLDDLAERDIMPNVRQMIRKGIFRRMESSLPEVSSVAWSSIITGKNPGEHGIFGFTDVAQGTYRLCFPNFNDLKAVPFWKNGNNKNSIIINVPSTFPAKVMNGIHISGFVSLDLERSVYPSSLVPELKTMDYRIDVDSDKAYKSFDLFLNDLDKTLHARIKAYRYLWDRYDWCTFMLVFTGTDRLMHFLWDAYEDENHRFHRDFIGHFKKIDRIIGEIISKLTKEDDFVILSDHGFEKLENDVYINCILKREGFLKLTGEKRLNLSRIDYGTKAFALDPGRIYINLKGKYPRGSVACQDRENVVKNRENFFETFRINNERVIKHVYRKEEIYKGPYCCQAPDIILVGNKGFNLKANINSEKVYSESFFTGKHTQDDAFLLVNNKHTGDIVPENPGVCDVIDIINQSPRKKVALEKHKTIIKDHPYYHKVRRQGNAKQLKRLSS